MRRPSKISWRAALLRRKACFSGLQIQPGAFFLAQRDVQRRHIGLHVFGLGGAYGGEQSQRIGQYIGQGDLRHAATALGGQFFGPAQTLEIVRWK